MSLKVIKEIYKSSKAKSERKYKTDFSVSANKMINLRKAYRKDLKALHLPDLPLEFKRLYRSIAMMDINARRDWNRLGLYRSIVFDIESIKLLSTEEARSILWHELGHVKYAQKYPDKSRKAAILNRKGLSFRREEEKFADAFAYKKFGDAFVDAMTKSIAYAGKELGKSEAEIKEKIEKFKRELNES
jgi:hypothetical protein